MQEKISAPGERSVRKLLVVERYFLPFKKLILIFEEPKNKLRARGFVLSAVKEQRVDVYMVQQTFFVRWCLFSGSSQQ